MDVRISQRIFSRTITFRFLIVLDPAVGVKTTPNGFAQIHLSTGANATSVWISRATVAAGTFEASDHIATFSVDAAWVSKALVCP